ncbi:MAG: hypothetical protein DDT33_01343 [Firmicutes bacterium]|nr:hypothetical protein [Bacillota bacterium]
MTKELRGTQATEKKEGGEMKVLKHGRFSDLVWLPKGESFPGTIGIGLKQGYYLLWTGANLSDFRSYEYLGIIRPSEYDLSARM